MFHKAKKIIGKVLFVCLIVCCVLFVLYGAAHAFFHNIPISKKPVDVSLTVTKLDAAGEPVDTFPTTIRGNIEKYLRQKDRLNVYIEPFDGYTDFRQHNNSVISHLFADVYYTSYCATGDSGNEFFYLYFTENFERVAIRVEKYTDDDPFYVNARYVASTNKNDTLTDLKNCFNGFLHVKNPILMTDPALDWQMHGTFIRADGTQQAMDLTIAGKILDYSNKDFYKLDLQIAFPESFDYQIATPSDGFASMKYDNQNTPNLYICSATSVNKDKPLPSKPVSTHFAIDIEKEYFIVIFKDAPECYFVASTDNTTCEEILLHFQDFTQTYKSLFWQD